MRKIRWKGIKFSAPNFLAWPFFKLLSVLLGIWTARQTSESLISNSSHRLCILSYKSDCITGKFPSSFKRESTDTWSNSANNFRFFWLRLLVFPAFSEPRVDRGKPTAAQALPSLIPFLVISMCRVLYELPISLSLLSSNMKKWWDLHKIHETPHYNLAI